MTDPHGDPPSPAECLDFASQDDGEGGEGDDDDDDDGEEVRSSTAAAAAFRASTSPQLAKGIRSCHDSGRGGGGGGAGHSGAAEGGASVLGGAAAAPSVLVLLRPPHLPPLALKLHQRQVLQQFLTRAPSNP